MSKKKPVYIQPSSHSGAITWGDKARQMAAQNRKGTKKRKLMWKDICDYCREEAWAYKNQVAMRRKGYIKKFLCDWCAQAKKGKYGKGVVPVWRRFGDWREKHKK